MVVSVPAPLKPFETTLVLVVALTALRVAVLFATPLELYPDEAQYWVWSRHLAFGYFSKPPMIAWLIRATTAIGGQHEAWVRLSAPLLHGVAALALQRAGARLYDGWVGFGAALLYSLMPGVQLSSGIMSTDAPLLLCGSLALWAFAVQVTARDEGERRRAALALGAALGFGALAKYAALYFVIGLVLYALTGRDGRRCWRPTSLTIAGAAFLVVLGPNLVWNAAHGFATVAHTVSDADWARPTPNGGHPPSRGGFDPRQAPGFLLSQFGVFGPIPFAVLIGGAAWTGMRRTITAHDRLLLCLTLPPLAIILGQALISRANANWAAAAYVPASLLCAGWLLRWRAMNLFRTTVAVQALAGAVFMGAAMSPAFANQIGLANGFKRARGWQASASAVEQMLRTAQATGPVSAVAVDDRFLFNALSYYGRAQFTAAGAPPLRMWVRLAGPNNEAERAAPLTTQEGARVLFVSAEPAYRPEIVGDFGAAGAGRSVRIRLDPKHERELFLFVGADFRPRPRTQAR